MFAVLTDDWPTFAFGVMAWFVIFMLLDAGRYLHQVFYLKTPNVKPYSLEELGTVVLTGFVLFVVFPLLYHLSPWVVMMLATAIPALGWRRIIAKITDPKFISSALQKSGSMSGSPETKAVFDLANTTLQPAGPKAQRPLRPLRRKSQRSAAQTPQ